MPIDGTAIERGYSTSIYPKIQAVLTPVSNFVPFALFDVLTVVAVVVLILAVVFAAVRAKAERRVRPLLGLLASTVTSAAIVYLVFLAVWGLNYRRVPMEQRLAFDRGAPSTEQVVTLWFRGDSPDERTGRRGSPYRVGARSAIRPCVA